MRQRRAVTNRGRPGQVTVVDHVGPASGGAEDRSRRLALYVGVLAADHATAAQQPGGDPLDRPDRLQTVVTGPQRHRRVVQAGLDVHLFVRLQRDVRRVGDDEVDGAVELGQRVGDVAEPQVDRGAGQVGGGEGVRLGRQLDRVHPRGGHLGGQRGGDRAGAGAQVDSHRVAELAQPLDRPPGQQLGLGPGHEHARPHPQLDGAEGRGAEQVLQRLAALTPREQPLELGALSRPHLGGAEQPAAGDIEHVGQQQVGVGGGRRDARSGQPADRLGTQLAHAGWCVRAAGHCPTAASRACSAASTEAATRSSRAPSRTASRL